MTKLKSEATPEEWEAHLEYHRQRRLNRLDQERARLRIYKARDDVKERRRKRDADPDRVAKRRAYAQSDEGKAKAKERYAERRSDPAKWTAILERQRRQRTGFTADQIAALLISQENKCAVCQRSFDGKQIRADHCHESGQPRGLLCHHCNIIEGMLKSMGIPPDVFAVKLSHYLSHPPILR